MIGQPTSRKTQNLLSQIERRMGELNPDERCRPIRKPRAG